jgi:hypothetical protein
MSWVDNKHFEDALTSTHSSHSRSRLHVRPVFLIIPPRNSHHASKQPETRRTHLSQVPNTCAFPHPESQTPQSTKSTCPPRLHLRSKQLSKNYNQRQRTANFDLKNQRAQRLQCGSPSVARALTGEAEEKRSEVDGSCRIPSKAVGRGGGTGQVVKVV